MTQTRREFIVAAAGAAAVIGLAGAPAFGRRREAEKKLRILMLGGTGFLGPHIVERAIERGHDVTLFNRGRSNPHLFPDLVKLEGDRDPNKGEGLNALEEGEWDVVIDTSGYVPRIVDASASLLKDRVKQYIFISTISVYADTSKVGIKEQSPLATIPDESTEEINGVTYGALKALCEQAAEKVMPGRVTNIRPGFIVGPRDTSGRFTYWPVRVSEGGEMVAPGEPGDGVQFIDARDLAAFIVHAAEKNTTGVFNATSPANMHTMGDVLTTAKRAINEDVELVWIPGDFLASQGLPPGAMPIWIPEVPGYEGFHKVDVSQAIAHGLTFRPVKETLVDTLEWYKEQPEDKKPRIRGGIPREKEAAILEAWKARGNE